MPTVCWTPAISGNTHFVGWENITDVPVQIQVQGTQAQSLHFADGLSSPRWDKALEHREAGGY